MLQDPLLMLTISLKAAIAGLLVLAAARDIMTRSVPNWIPLALAGLCAAIALADLRLLWGLGFGLGVFLLCTFFWRRGWMGGADVKLLGAAGIAVAPSDVETFVLGVTLFGGVMAVLYLTSRFVLPKPSLHRPRRLLARVLRIEAWRIHHGGPLPYACAIAAGTLFVLR